MKRKATIFLSILSLIALFYWYNTFAYKWKYCNNTDWPITIIARSISSLQFWKATKFKWQSFYKIQPNECTPTTNTNHFNSTFSAIFYQDDWNWEYPLKECYTAVDDSQFTFTERLFKKYTYFILWELDTQYPWYRCTLNVDIDTWNSK